MTRIALVISALIVGAAGALSADWPMWGGTPSRNMVSAMKGLPTRWDVKTGTNVKWVAELGSQSYGNPVVANGVVLIGTNNEALRDPKQGGDRGVLMAFREANGEFLWQATFEKLSSGVTSRPGAITGSKNVLSVAFLFSWSTRAPTATRPHA